MKSRVISLLMCLVSCSSAMALTGQELAQLVYDREDGDDAYFKTEMILIDKNGRERQRLLQSVVREDDGLIKSYVEFLEPPDIRGTRFLSLEQLEGDDIQYLYLPELGRSRRIVSSQKTLSFVNTDFSYEDMQRRKPLDDDHQILANEIFEGSPVYLLESRAHEGTSQYGQRISRIGVESLIPVTIDFYDRKGRKVKELRVRDIRRIDGIWTAMEMEMSDLKAGHRTRMRIQEVRYNQGIDESVFELRNLEH